jgi:hypothetical protein
MKTINKFVIGLLLVTWIVNVSPVSGLTLSGFVKNTQNQTLAKATVLLDSTMQTTTDINGYYTFANITEGQHVFNASLYSYVKKVSILDILNNGTYNVSLYSNYMPQTDDQSPGFEGIFAIIGIIGIAIYIKRR